jgi:CheY-like chemotaxis protein
MNSMGARYMAHALIIGDNMIINRAIASCLISLGFSSFDHTWTEAQALSIAARRPPDLVVVNDTVACGSPLTVARHMAEQSDAPILVVNAGQCEVRRRVPEGAIFDGPFSLSDMGNAVAVARRSRRTSATRGASANRQALLTTPHAAGRA